MDKHCVPCLYSGILLRKEGRQAGRKGGRDGGIEGEGGREKRNEMLIHRMT